MERAEQLATALLFGAVAKIHRRAIFIMCTWDLRHRPRVTDKIVAHGHGLRSVPFIELVHSAVSLVASLCLSGAEHRSGRRSVFNEFELVGLAALVSCASACGWSDVGSS